MNYTLLLTQMLFVMFVGLKLSGQIDWSWWLVFAPLWGYGLTLLTVGFIAGFVGAYRAVRHGAAERDRKFDDVVDTLRRNAIAKANDDRRGEGRV